VTPPDISKESGWKPSTYRARASSRPYWGEGIGKVPSSTGGNSLVSYSTARPGLYGGCRVTGIPTVEAVPDKE